MGRANAEQPNASAGRSGSAPSQSAGAPPKAFGGQGHTLGNNDGIVAENSGNLSPEERRQRALDAAEKRQIDCKGISQEKAIELRDKQQKDALLAKIDEYYRQKKIDMPLGLGMASLEQLKQHWETCQKGN